MGETEFLILDLINKNKDITQRKIATELGISVGKVNGILNNFIELGYIEVIKLLGNQVRKQDYIITSAGINFLEHYLGNKMNIKINLPGYNNYNIRQAVILAAGERKEFSQPVAMLEIDNRSVIKRSMEILSNNGIEQFVIVTGYKSEYFEEFEKINNVKVIVNEKYKWTGTMSSLVLARKYIDEDFLLVEGDMVYEERAISDVLKNKNRDCMLITNESGSGDEAFVEIKNGYIHKMSKDIHQLNRVDGEMIGISKISIDIFDKIIELFKENRNPYLNYEYLILDVGRSYNIGYEKIDDLVWAELDTKEHYEKLKNYIFPTLKRKEKEVERQFIRKYLMDALNVQESEIGAIVNSGGMTNKNYKVSIKNENYVLRIPGIGTDDMICRLDEKINSSLSYEIGLDTKILYFDENSGVKIARFIENAETLTSMSAKREENMKLTAAILKKLHTSGVKFNNSFDVFEKIELYESLLNRANGKNFDDYYEVKERVAKLKDMLRDMSVELVSCHNDTVPENFIKSGDDNIYLIDWEYSGMNDAMWDLAAHCQECGFSEDEEELFLSKYFDGKVNECCRKRILIHKICQDFLWSIWTNIKEAKGDEFGTYGIDRYMRAKKNLDVLELL